MKEGIRRKIFRVLRCESALRKYGANQILVLDIQANPQGPDICHHDESPFPSCVIPVLWFFRRVVGLSAPTFQFDARQGQYICLAGRRCSKAIGGLLACCAIIFSLAQSKLDQVNVHHNTVLVMHKLLTMTRCFAIISLYHIMMSSGNDICQIFNDIQRVRRVSLKAGGRIPSRQKVFRASAALTFVNALLAVVYVLTTIDSRVNMIVSPNNYTGVIRTVADTQIGSLLLLVGHGSAIGLDSHRFSDGKPDAVVWVTAVASVFMNWWTCLCWSAGFVLVTAWGTLFWLLLEEFFAAADDPSVQNSTVEDIRSFLHIKDVLDRFNSVFDRVTLANVLMASLYFSMNIFTVFTDSSSLVQRLAAAGAFLWFGLQLWISAEIHERAGKIVGMFKSRFQAGPRWRQCQGDHIETTEGMMLVLHQFQTGSIGFKGMGFFTCTYGFFGAVLSAISTYAVIASQFQA